MHVIAALRQRSRTAVLLGTLLATSLGLAPTTSAAGAGAGRATAPIVKAAHLPTFAEVDALYPGFEGGSRETTPYRETFVLEKNCRTYADGPRSDKGRYADYFGAFGNIPVHDGYEQPSVFTMSFATVKAAKQAFAAQQSWIKACDDETVHSPMETNSYAKAPLSGLGDQRVAYRHSMTLEQTGDDPWYLNELAFWVREGRFLLDVRVRLDVQGQEPAKAPLVSLARVALDRLP